MFEGLTKRDIEAKRFGVYGNPGNYGHIDHMHKELAGVKQGVKDAASKAGSSLRQILDAEKQRKLMAHIDNITANDPDLGNAIKNGYDTINNS